MRFEPSGKIEPARGESQSAYHLSNIRISRTNYLQPARWITIRNLAVVLVLALSTSPAFALDLEPDAVFIRVADVGNVLCCIVVMPENLHMVYDPGHYTRRGLDAHEAIEELIPADATISLLVLSHSDADHLGAVDEIFQQYNVDRVIRSGYVRDTATWRNANTAITTADDNGFKLDLNLRDVEFPMGATYLFGETYVTMITGFHEPPNEWGITNRSELQNAGSIVVRLVYRGNSILSCGDTVGRHSGDPDNVCIAAERFMVENSAVIPIDSNVIIAPHHGDDNGNSTRFIQAVSPDSVIFSAGHVGHEHPREAAAQRYLNFGVPSDHMFRTDLGGEDDVDILLRSNGTVVVAYRSQ